MARRLQTISSLTSSASCAPRLCAHSWPVCSAWTVYPSVLHVGWKRNCACGGGLAAFVPTLAGHTWLRCLRPSACCMLCAACKPVVACPALQATRRPHPVRAIDIVHMATARVGHIYRYIYIYRVGHICRYENGGIRHTSLTLSGSDEPVPGLFRGSANAAWIALMFADLPGAPPKLVATHFPSWQRSCCAGCGAPIGRQHALQWNHSSGRAADNHQSSVQLFSSRASAQYVQHALLAAAVQLLTRC